MMRDAKPDDDTRPERRLRRIGLIAAGLMAIAIYATACAGDSGGPGVAGAGISNSPGASPSADRREVMLAYAQCMRDHGISDFPDPDAEGHLLIHGEPGGAVDPDSPQFDAAYEACRSLIPQLSAEEQDQANAWQLEIARCMRQHGFPSFPDPVPNERGFPLDEVEVGSDVDPRNPQFQAALEACEAAASDDAS